MLPGVKAKACTRVCALLLLLSWHIGDTSRIGRSLATHIGVPSFLFVSLPRRHCSLVYNEQDARWFENEVEVRFELVSYCSRLKDDKSFARAFMSWLIQHTVEDEEHHHAIYQVRYDIS